MGKNKKQSKKTKPNVFKVAGAKSLKKSKSKPVNLGLKNIKNKVEDIDAQLVELSKKPKTVKPQQKPQPKKNKKKQKKGPSKEDISKTAEKIVKMDI